MRISDWSSDVCSSDLGDGDANLPEAGAAFRQVLALLIAQRRPSFYLRGGRAELEALTASYLRLMADAGVISMSLRDAALRAPLNFADDAPPPRRLPPSSVKAINGTRDRTSTRLNSSH